jgi:hypothetical protein
LLVEHYSWSLQRFYFVSQIRRMSARARDTW